MRSSAAPQSAAAAAAAVVASCHVLAASVAVVEVRIEGNCREPKWMTCHDEPAVAARIVAADRIDHTVAEVAIVAAATADIAVAVWQVAGVVAFAAAAASDFVPMDWKASQ